MKPGEQCGQVVPIPDHPMAPSCMWFNNNTIIDTPTLDESLRTYQDAYFNTDTKYDWTKHNPWRSPGAAPIHSPCGVAGGNPNGCPDGSPQGPGYDCPGGGYSHGPFAEAFHFPGVQTTQWSIGSKVEVAWAILANHGGGYSYRLCKVPAQGVSGVTEECFQRTPLKFAGSTQWVQYGENITTRMEFVANRTDVGTTPVGSQWTKNPIPGCSSPDGGFYSKDTICHDGTQFPPPLPGLEGFGEIESAAGTPTFLFSIGDYLEVPDNLEPGDYVLSFRWDCEQTSQVWATCASIKLIQ